MFFKHEVEIIKIYLLLIDDLLSKSMKNSVTNMVEEKKI